MTRIMFVSLILFSSLALGSFSELKPETQKQVALRFGENPKWTPALLDQLIQFLISEAGLDSAKGRISEAGDLVLEVSYPSQIKSFLWKNNEAFTTSEIENIFSYKNGEAFNERRLYDSAERVRLAYVSRGYVDAQIDIELSEVSDSERAVTLTLTEGRPQLITEIEVLTTNSNLKNQLQRVTRKFLKTPATATSQEEIISEMREFLQNKRYLRARVENPVVQELIPSEMKLSFRILDPDVYFVEYKGLKHFSSGRMDEELALGSTLSTNPNFAAELANKVKSRYLQEGFARVEVEAVELPGGRNFEKKISIRIKENSRIRINSFQISGQFSEKTEFARKKVFQFGGPLLEKGYFSSEMLDKGLAEFVTSRRNLGFLQAQVLSQRATYNASRNAVDIFVTFDEGPLTKIESLTFEGNVSFTTAELLEQFDVKEQDPLDILKLDNSLKKLIQFYKQNGFLEMFIENQKDQGVSLDSSQTRASVSIRIFEGPLVKVGSIRIEGLTLTRPEIVRRELEFKEGDTLTPETISGSIRNLQRQLNFSVEISTLEDRTNVSSRTVVIRVTERDPGSFNIGMGATNERQLTLRGFAGISYRNLFGTARAVSLRVEGNYNIANIQYLERKVTLGYLEPYLLNSQTRGRISLSNSSALDDTDTTLANEITQVTFTLEKDFTNYFTTSWDLWSLATITNFKWKDDEILNSNRIASTAFNFDLDFRDHPFTPTSGTFSKLTLEYGSPDLGSSKTIEYLRGFASVSQYTNLSGGDWIWANSIRGGYLKNLNKISRDEGGGVPYDKKGFSLGGQATVRGFEPGEKFPNIFELGIRDYALQTEAYLWVVKTELRFPIYSNIGGALFYDGGSVTLNDDVPIAEGSSILVPYSTKVTDRYRDTVGVALRYNTPAGALSIETAWKLDRRSDRNENQLPILISFGTF